jgi:hypothetical protein
MQRSSTMTDATHFYLDRLLNQLSGECTSAQARIRTARTMREVKHASNVHASPMIRALPQARQQLHRVHDQAETRMVELLDKQLKDLGGLQSNEPLRAAYGQLLRNDWCFLRGDFARVYVRADREYQRLLHTTLQREKQSVEDRVDPAADLDQDDGDSPAP